MLILSNIIGVEIKESTVYGKGSTDFDSKQRMAQTDATIRLVQASEQIHKIISSICQDFDDLQNQQYEKYVNEQIKHKLEGKKDMFIGIDPALRGMLTP